MFFPPSGYPPLTDPQALERLGAEELAQSVKRLSYMHKNLSSDSWHPYKKLDVV